MRWQVEYIEPKISSTPFGHRVSLYIHPKLMVFVVDDNNEDNDIVTIDNDNKKQLVFFFNFRRVIFHNY